MRKSGVISTITEAVSKRFRWCPPRSSAEPCALRTSFVINGKDRVVINGKDRVVINGKERIVINGKNKFCDK